MKNLKTILKSFLLAFSLYSKIPVPFFKMDEKEMKFHLCFFPFVGILIGIFEFFLFELKNIFNFSKFFCACFAVIIPVLITGGFHLDGFIDTLDAYFSYQNKEKKLEILKDPHIGAFSVIYLGIYFIASVACVFEILDFKNLMIFFISFYFSRIFSAISVIYFPKAKKNGMLFLESKACKKISFVLILEFIAGIIFLFLMTKSIFICFLTCVCVFLSFLFYFYFSKKHFGGITGDLAGFFVVFCEFILLSLTTLISILK